MLARFTDKHATQPFPPAKQAKAGASLSEGSWPVELTHAEKRILGAARRDSANGSTGLRIPAVLWLTGMFLGCALIVIPDIVNFIRGAGFAAEVLDTVGFAVVLMAFALSEVAFAQFRSRAFSLIRKLSQSA